MIDDIVKYKNRARVNFVKVCEENADSGVIRRFLSKHSIVSREICGGLMPSFSLLIDGKYQSTKYGDYLVDDENGFFKVMTEQELIDTYKFSKAMLDQLNK